MSCLIEMIFARHAPKTDPLRITGSLLLAQPQGTTAGLEIKPGVKKVEYGVENVQDDIASAWAKV